MVFAILTTMILNFGCDTIHEYFPDKRDVLTSNFNEHENFLPIATLDLSSKGIKDKIHIMYVSFDPLIDHKKSFPDKDNIDAFSFKIDDKGKLQPTFDKSALIIETYKKYLVINQEKYNKIKQQGREPSFIDLSDEPEWWQDDATPVNSKGKPMTFICQVDMYKFTEDNFRLFVFYDETDRIVKYIYQRD